MKKLIFIIFIFPLIANAQIDTAVFRGNNVFRYHGIDTIVGYMSKNIGAGYSGFINYAGGKYSIFAADSNGDGILWNQQKKLRFVGNTVISKKYSNLTESSAILALNDTAGGFLVPRITALQKAAIVAPATGLLIYQTNGAKGFYTYNGSAWEETTNIYYNGTNANTVTIGSGVTSSSYSLTLPTAQGGASTFLQNNGSGVLSWASAGGGITVGTTTITSGTTGRIAINLSGIYQENISYFSSQGVNDNTHFGYTSATAALGGSYTGGSNSLFGAYAGRGLTSGNFNAFFGKYAGLNVTTFIQSVAIGAEAGKAGGDASIAIGYLATVGSYDVVIGANATAPISGGILNIALGYEAGVGTTAGLSSTLCIGRTAHATASNQAVIGSSKNSFGTFNEIYFNSVTHTAAQGIILNACGGAGTDNAGGSLTLAGGKGTGNATTGGSIIFKTANDTTSGTTPQKLKNRWQITPKGNLLPSSTSSYDLGGTNNKVDSIYANVITGYGYGDIVFPHAQYSDTTDQLVTSTTMAKAILFNCQDDTLGIYDVGDSLFYVRRSGDYEIIISAIVDASGGTPGQHMNIWFNQNGTNVPRSNTIVQIPNTNTEMVVAVGITLEMTAGQYFKILFHGDATTVLLNYTTGATAPVRPVSPSIIMNIKKISK